MKLEKTTEKEFSSMLKTAEPKEDIYNTEALCDKLIPPDSFYRKFREVVWPLLKEDDFASMYCEDNGRPAINPTLLAMATILQFHKDLSDREMERASMYDLEIKYGLGLRLDERPFDHSSLGDFRQRLLKHGKEKMIFERILERLIQDKFIEKGEIQRIDATHIIADVAIPSMVQLVKKGAFEVLKTLKCQHKKVYEAMAQQIDLTKYTRETVNQESEGRNSDDKRKKKLVEVVQDARIVLKHTTGLKTSRRLRKRIDLLERILQQNIEEDQHGEPREKDTKQKPPDLLVSPIDEDARYGMKSVKKRFVGYKANLTETTQSRFITNVKVMKGNQRDGDTTIDAVKEQNVLGLTPIKLIGDTAYSDGAYRKELKQNGTQVVAPLRAKNTRTRSVFPKSMFVYDEIHHTVTCPQGVTTKESYHDSQKDIRMYHFPRTRCQLCLVQAQCTNSSEGRRTIGIAPSHKELLEAETYNMTQAFKDDMKLRPVIEGTHSEMKRYHGLRRARFRGLRKLSLQCYFTAVVVNVKRWIKRLKEGIIPKAAFQMAF